MKEIGRRIYYDNTTGNVILDTGERQGSVFQTTIDYDIEVFKELSQRNRHTFDVLEMPFGAFSQDFTECSGYRIDLETKELEFSYPDPNEPEQPAEFTKPLTVQIKELESENILLKAQNQAISERADFIEDCIAEMAMTVYQ